MTEPTDEQKLDFANKLFQFTDEDNDGAITFDEFRTLRDRLIAQFGEQASDLAPRSEDHYQAKFDSIDVDQDGKVTREEFLDDILHFLK
ncbi:hypothetical protein BDV25DRAFT_137252 [Aspergillus avenaceus]|uniref:EF-hand domain-containing protein n=1 Tax=Aspergillus avenaceus TaxID=36643 RepID=A0A5N6U373_ASPAV|nr:hypothetical protein BDV25DRAFT_137252 [Aspergillus avenaceus]